MDDTTPLFKIEDWNKFFKDFIASDKRLDNESFASSIESFLQKLNKDPELTMKKLSKNNEQLAFYCWLLFKNNPQHSLPQIPQSISNQFSFIEFLCSKALSTTTSNDHSFGFWMESIVGILLNSSTNPTISIENRTILQKTIESILRIFIEKELKKDNNSFGFVDQVLSSLLNVDQMFLLNSSSFDLLFWRSLKILRKSKPQLESIHQINNQTLESLLLPLIEELSHLPNSISLSAIDELNEESRKSALKILEFSISFKFRSLRHLLSINFSMTKQFLEIENQKEKVYCALLLWKQQAPPSFPQSFQSSNISNDFMTKSEAKAFNSLKDEEKVSKSDFWRLNSNLNETIQKISKFLENDLKISQSMAFEGLIEIIWKRMLHQNQNLINKNKRIENKPSNSSKTPEVDDENKPWKNKKELFGDKFVLNFLILGLGFESWSFSTRCTQQCFQLIFELIDDYRAENRLLGMECLWSLLNSIPQNLLRSQYGALVLHNIYPSLNFREELIVSYTLAIIVKCVHLPTLNIKSTLSTTNDFESLQFQRISNDDEWNEEQQSINGDSGKSLENSFSNIVQQLERSLFLPKKKLQFLYCLYLRYFLNLVGFGALLELSRVSSILEETIKSNHFETVCCSLDCLESILKQCWPRFVNSFRNQHQSKKMEGFFKLISNLPTSFSESTISDANISQRQNQILKLKSANCLKIIELIKQQQK